MEDDQIEMLRENEICVVVAKDPAAIKFMDPIPSMSSRTQMEAAAIELSRRIMTGQTGRTFMGSTTQAAAMWAEILMEGNPLESNVQEHTTPRNRIRKS